MYLNSNSYKEQLFLFRKHILVAKIRCRSRPRVQIICTKRLGTNCNLGIFPFIRPIHNFKIVDIPGIYVLILHNSIGNKGTNKLLWILTKEIHIANVKKSAYQLSMAMKNKADSLVDKCCKTQWWFSIKYHTHKDLIEQNILFPEIDILKFREVVVGWTLSELMIEEIQISWTLKGQLEVTV